MTTVNSNLHRESPVIAWLLSGDPSIVVTLANISQLLSRNRVLSQCLLFTWCKEKASITTNTSYTLSPNY